MNVFIKNNIENFKMRDKIFHYLKAEWQVGYNPNLDRIMHDLRVFDINSRSYFYNALDWLVKYGIALVKICEDGVERIIPHPNLELEGFILDFPIDSVEY